jgi:hypothetical protein
MANWLAGKNVIAGQVHDDKIPSRFHIQLFALLVADHHFIFAAAFADPLSRRAGDNTFAPRKIRR